MICIMYGECVLYHITKHYVYKSRPCMCGRGAVGPVEVRLAVVCTVYVHVCV